MGRAREGRRWIALAFVLLAGLGGECHFSFSSDTSDRRRRDPPPLPPPILVPPGGSAVALSDGVRLAISDPGAGTVSFVERGTGLSTGIVARFEAPSPLAAEAAGTVLVGHARGVSRLDPDDGTTSPVPIPEKRVVDLAADGARIGALCEDGSIAFTPSAPPGAGFLAPARALAATPQGIWYALGEDGGLRRLREGGAVDRVGFVPAESADLLSFGDLVLVLGRGGDLHRFEARSGGYDSLLLASPLAGFVREAEGRSFLAWREGGPVLALDPSTGASSPP